MVASLARDRGRPAGGPASGGNIIPFRRASVRKQNSLGQLTQAMSTAAFQFPSQQIVSQGYIAALKLMLSSGTITAGTTLSTSVGGDLPWTILSLIQLLDSSAAPIYSMTGYDSFVHSKYMMGHRGWVDQSSDTTIYGAGTYTSSTVAATWMAEIPVANNDRDQIGLLPNQSDAYKFFLNITQAANSAIWSTVGSGALTPTINMFYEYMTIPQAQGPGGVQQQQTPELYGVVHQVNDYQATQNGYTGGPITNQKLNLDTGKVYRGVGLVFRDSGVTTGNTQRSNVLTNVRVKYGDDVQVWAASGQDIRSDHFLRNGRDLPTGVYIVDFMSDSGLWVGDDFRRDYLDTRDLAQVWMELDLAQSSGSGTGTVTPTVFRDVFLVPAGIAI